VIPPSDSPQTALSEPLTRLVSEEGHAVWIANQRGSDAENRPRDFADAFCVPLVQAGAVLGAVHVYLERGRFRQSDFEFGISVANITAVALARARHEESLNSDIARLKATSPGYDELVGSCPAMQELTSKLTRMARASGCVLIRGESGSGKELVARAVHRASARADRPMLSVNCAAIPADLMESQLFGHKAGSFTGASNDHQGYFQQADLGTLFLDEVGEMTLIGQSKLLRILEGHPFLPVGSSVEVRVDVRVIAATNRDLLAYVREKKFREDLYYRLSVFELIVPPLRERGEDIALLIDFFLDHFRRQHGRPELDFSPAARAKLLAYSWPGNVRQLRNVIDSAVVLAMGNQIEAGDLGMQEAVSGELDSLRIDVWEQRLIAEAMRRTGGNLPEVARLLGVGRATIYRKIEEYGIARK
ncbi:MAG TPA: sigma-54-dependent Fis family transcriptional regulator, partial [Pirellulales bacterium]